MVKKITGVILAGGSNKRLNGIIKANILIRGRTIISRIIETLGDIFEEVVIVTNTPDKFHQYSDNKIIVDKILNKGPLGGIHSAMKESENEALFVVAGDMPLLDREIITRQIDFYNNNKCDIIIPQIDQYIEPLHGIYKCTLISILEDYLKKDISYSIRGFFSMADVCYMQIEGSEKSRSAFTNINTPDDISTIKKHWGIV